MFTLERDLDASIMATSKTLTEANGKTTHTPHWGGNEPRNNEIFSFWFWRMAREVLAPKAWIKTEPAMNEIKWAMYDVLDPAKQRREDNDWLVGLRSICQFNFSYYLRFCDSLQSCKEATIAWLVVCKRSPSLHNEHNLRKVIGKLILARGGEPFIWNKTPPTL